MPIIRDGAGQLEGFSKQRERSLVPRRCVVCKEPAHWLCDCAVEGCIHPRRPGIPTCDTPLCAAHAYRAHGGDLCPTCRPKKE